MKDEQQLNQINDDRLQTRRVDEFIGLARGLIADGNINPTEEEFLEKWLITNLSISHQPLIATLYDRVREILADGVVDAEACADLFEALTNSLPATPSWAKHRRPRRSRCVIPLRHSTCRGSYVVFPGRSCLGSGSIAKWQ